MQVRLLGPLEVTTINGPAALGGPKERMVLAVLALRANQAVGEDAIADALWGDDPPRTAAKTVRSYVSRLRAALAEAAVGDAGPAIAIDTTPAGYVLRVGEHGRDVDEVEALAAHAHEAVSRGDHAWAAVAFGQALAAWRGVALGEVADKPFARSEARRVEELHAGLVEARIDAELACGRHDGLLGELEALTHEHRWRERLWAQRMTALYRAGRQADALRVYQDLRAHLIDELGIEPGPSIAALEGAILRQDPALDWAGPIDGDARPEMRADLPTGVVTFLLTDIVGSASLWDADARAMAEAMVIHDNLITRVVTVAGGRVLKAKGEGDATLSVFHRASDAAATAFALQSDFGVQAWPGDLDVRVRVALHTGEAFERDGDYFGPTVNRAARIRSLASGQQVLASQATAELVRDRLPGGAALVDLGVFELRGMAREERLFELAPPRSGPGTAGVGPLEVPLVEALAAGGVFVGRDEELDALSGMWTDAAHGSRGAAVIAGEAGIGKTRLAAALAERARPDGVVLFGRCDEDLGVPYQPFAAALAHFVAHGGADHRSLLGPMAGELVRLLPNLASMVQGLPAPVQADADTERYRLFEAVAGWLSATSQCTPILLVIDDLHWAAKPTLLMLRHLLRSDLPMSLLILATYRDTELDRRHPLAETLADLRRDAAMNRIALSGLDVAGTEAVLASVAGRDLGEAERTMAAQLHAQTAGNPFFIREVMRHMVDVGAVSQRDGQWTVAAGAEEVGLPEGVRDVVTRRLSHLSTEANRALSVASVIGPTFALSLLERVPEAGDDPRALLDALDEAVGARLVIESTDRPGHYAFGHALIRQTIDSELTSTRRARLHRRVGEAIEAGADASSHTEALAFHFAEAALDGQIAKAADYALAAARRATAQLAHEEAIAHLERGLAALDLDPSPDLARRADLGLARADALYGLNDRPAAHDAGIDAAADAQRIGSAERLGQAAYRLLYWASNFVRELDTEAVCDAALAALGTQHPELRALILANLAEYELIARYEYERARADAQEALDFARTTNNGPLLVAAMRSQVLVAEAAAIPHRDEELVLLTELVATCAEYGERQAQCEALFFRSTVHLSRGDRDAVRADIDTAADLAAEDRLSFGRPTTLASKACVAVLDGRFADAEDLLQRATDGYGGDVRGIIVTSGVHLVLRREQGRGAELRDMALALLEFLPGVPIVEVGMAAFYALAGDTGLAGKALAWAVEGDLAAVPRDTNFLLGLSILSEACAILSDVDAAAVVARHLEPFSGLAISVMPICLSFGSVDRYLGMLAATQGHWDEADAYYRAAVTLDQQLQSPPFTARTKFWWGRMLLARDAPGDADRAAELFSAALATAEALGIEDLTTACRARP